MPSGHIGHRDGPRGRSWYYTIPVTRPDGTKGQEQKRGFPTKKEANAAMRKRLVELETGTAGFASSQTLTEYIAFWLSQIKRDVTAHTLGAYERALRIEILPRIGTVRLDQLTSLQIDAAYTRALEEGRSVLQIRAAHTRLSQALKRAVHWDLIPRNPCERVRSPKVRRVIEEPGEGRVRALTDEEAKRLLGSLKGPGWLAAYLAFGLGLRRGEVLGLRWRDVDFEAQTISIRQTVGPAPQSGLPLVIGPPKTEASRRTFQAPECVLCVLREHRGHQSARRLVAGAEWQDNDLVLCHDDGRPIEPHRVNEWHRSARRRSGVDQTIRFHDWRHTYATNSLRAGVDITTVSKRLGHASVSVTLDVYSHVLPDQQEVAARVAGEVLARVLGSA